MHTPHDTQAAVGANDPELAESLSRGHEQRDTEAKPIVVFAIVLTISVVAVQLLVWGMQRLMEHQDDLDGPAKISSVSQSLTSASLKNHVAAPEPRLQPSPFHPTFDHDDMATLNERWKEQLNTVGKFEGTDRVHIPVDRVIDMAVEKGIGSLKPGEAK